MTAEPDYYIGDFPLILRRHPRAKHLKLRYDARNGGAILTLPRGISDRKALQFAEKHHDWLQDQYDNSPYAIDLVAGETIPYQGHPVKIMHTEDRAAKVTFETDCLLVGGPRAGFEMRLLNWLKKQARLAMNDTIDDYAPRLGQRPQRVMIRDTSSRWGSCSSRKSLSFSWRLILAPPEILRYVVAHEMAHLVEMNHSPAFWAQVENLYPDWRRARAWLKSEGMGLMLIG